MVSVDLAYPISGLERGNELLFVDTLLVIRMDIGFRFPVSGFGFRVSGFREKRWGNRTTLN